jgi:uncharacterized protein with HEPN domain
LSRNEDAIRLRHMLDAVNKALEFSRGKDRSALDKDEVLALALVRLLEIIGEAAVNVSQATKDAHPSFPWRAMSSTRNRLIHGYFDVDYDIVWNIVSKDLPPTVSQIEEILKSV